MLSNFIIMKYINNKNNMTSAGAVIIVHFYSQGSEINTETDFLPIKSCNNKKKCILMIQCSSCTFRNKLVKFIVLKIYFYILILGVSKELYNSGRREQYIFYGIILDYGGL